MTAAMRHVAFCADDFGQSEPVDAGILALVVLGRLNAVSCMSKGLRFGTDAPALVRCAADIDLGLHVDLTQATPGRPSVSLARLITQTYLGAIDRAALARALASQLDAFEHTIGRAPDFIDGHQHVHQLPVVRDLLLQHIADRYGAHPPWVRRTVPASRRGGKAAIIATLGGRALLRDLERLRIPANTDFAGVYGFERGADYRRLMQRWMATTADRGLIMCHPGRACEDTADAIGHARPAELRYLESDAFPTDCRAAGVVPSRLPRR